MKCRTGATGGTSLMLSLSNSGRTAHLLTPDLCLSLLRASTLGLTQQVKNTGEASLKRPLPLEYVNIHHFIHTKKTVDETQ